MPSTREIIESHTVQRKRLAKLRENALAVAANHWTDADMTRDEFLAQLDLMDELLAETLAELQTSSLTESGDTVH